MLMDRPAFHTGPEQRHTPRYPAHLQGHRNQQYHGSHHLLNETLEQMTRKIHIRNAPQSTAGLQPPITAAAAVAHRRRTYSDSGTPAKDEKHATCVIARGCCRSSKRLYISVVDQTALGFID